MLEHGWKLSLQEGSYHRFIGIFFEKPTKSYPVKSYMLEVEQYGSRYCKYLVWLHPGSYSGSGIHCPLELASDKWHGESDLRILVIGLCGKLSWEWF